MKNKPNVILITVDSLRADHLGYMGYNKKITPNIDALAKESTIFTHAYSTGPVTPHSFPSILTSTYPFDYHGVVKIERPRVLISEIFKENGFITAAFHSNSYVSSFFGYNKGWDYFEDITVPYEKPEGAQKYGKVELFFKKLFKEPLKKILPYVSAESLFLIIYLNYRLQNTQLNFKIRAKEKNLVIKEFINSVKDQNKPFFIWIHYMDLHIPYISKKTRIYNRPLSFLEIACSNFGYISSPFYFKNQTLPKSLLKFGKRCINKTVELYDEELAYFDQQFGELIKFLKEEGIYDNSIICFTADHGDEFFEHKGGSHFQKLYNELLHVPLLIKDPFQKTNRIIDKKVSLIDLSPTLCDLAGLQKPPTFKGGNLFKDSRSLIFHQTSSDTKGGKYYVFGFSRLEQCKIGCQSEEWKYIIDYGKNTEELYNLLSDPKEQNNIIKLESKVALKMRNAIQDFNKENPPFSLLNKDNFKDISYIKI